MRHRRARTKLGRTSSHRSAMFSNLLKGLVENGRIETTERKAKELRGIAERAVTRATRLGDILLRDPQKLASDDKVQLIHALRMVRRQLRHREAVLTLFQDWAPRYLARPGGYTRMFKLGPRKGDGAPMAIVEFIPDPLPAREGQAKAPTAAKK